MGCCSGNWNPKKCYKVFFWAPVILIFALVVWSYYAYVISLCVFIIKSEAKKIIYIICYHILLLLFISNYLRAVFGKPMRPSDKYNLTVEEFNESIRNARNNPGENGLKNIVTKRKLNILNCYQQNTVRVCEHCYIIKPDRAHHCSTCETCLLKMDHHCPWVNNCVGYHNYKFFVVFLFWGFIYCAFICFSSLEYFIMFWKEARNYIPTQEFQLLFLFLASLMFGLSQIILLGYHLYLLVNNKTTLEAFRKPEFFDERYKKYGFNIGRMENIKEVLGDNILLWLLPIHTSRGDGCEFKVRAEMGDVESGYDNVTTDKYNDDQAAPQSPRSKLID